MRRLIYKTFVWSTVLFLLFIYHVSHFFDSDQSNCANVVQAHFSEKSLDLLQRVYNALSFTKETVQRTKYSILIVSDKKRALKYKQQSSALECYASRHFYLFSVMDPDQYYQCSIISNFFFKKHCAVLFYLIENVELEWVLVLDGDNLLVNASKRIEDYIPSDITIHVVHYERFYNGEIMAGNYLIRNHRWSYLYLIKWISLYEYLPQVYYHNHDNGALHLHLLLMLNVNIGILRKCYSLWQDATNETIYDRYVGCFKCALGGNRRLSHVRILRRGHGFARDYREPKNAVFGIDFLIHSFKDDTNQYYSQRIKPEECQTKTDWTPPIHGHLWIQNLSIAKELIRSHDSKAAIEHPDSVGFPDISHCWPECESELYGSTKEQYFQKLCK